MEREPSRMAPRPVRVLFAAGTTVGLTDGQLLERFATRGDEAGDSAFTALVERHGPMVLRACRGILRDEHAAMDAFQATFLALLKKGDRLWIEESLAPWLHRVACRAAFRLRSETNRRRILERRAAVRAEDACRPSPPDDLSALLHEEIDRLPEHYRLPIVLCDLEGRSCEEAARHLGRPVGTVGSRLSRGRRQLRARLARRGLAPAVGTLSAVATARVAVAESLVDSTVRLGGRWLASRSALGASSAGAVNLAEDLLRVMLMAKLARAGAVALVFGGVATLAGWAIGSAAETGGLPAQAQGAKAAQGEPAKARADRAEGKEKARYDGSLLAMVGNMRPLLHDEKGVRFQSREAILYKDGTAKLWSFEGKEPVGSPLKHAGPIRELAFLDAEKLLITTSDDSVKVWDGLTGRLKKELGGQVMRPLFFADVAGAKRFATLDREGRTVTTWDVGTLEPVGTFKPEGIPRLVGAGLSRDGRTLVTIGEDRSVTLWDVAANRSYAMLRLPSLLVARVFVDDAKFAARTPVQLDARFWEIVRPMAPAGEEKH